MTSRERVFAALEHCQPDRCPVDLWLEDSTVQTLMKHFQIERPEELNDIFEADLQFVFPDSILPEPEILPDGSWYDTMGTHRHRVRNDYCEYLEYASYPLAFAETVKDLEKYTRWPDPKAFDWEHFADKIGDLHDKRVIKLHAGGIYEVAWGLRGQEQLLMDMIIEPEIVHYIMEKLCGYWCDFVRFALDAAGDKIDLVYTYDDIATQHTLIMSPEMLEEFVYPYHRRVNGIIKSYGKKIIYHSCGSVVSQIHRLREFPIDVLNPLQPLAKGMDFEILKDTWGDSLCFLGGIDVQHLLPKGSVEEVREEVRRAVSVLGKNGGYILSSAHYIQNDTPIENIKALFDVSLR